MTQGSVTHAQHNFQQSSSSSSSLSAFHQMPIIQFSRLLLYRIYIFGEADRYSCRANVENLFNRLSMTAAVSSLF